MFHKHNWELIDKTLIPGLEGLGKVNAWGYEGLAMMDKLLKAKQDHVVHVFKCECGKVKVVKS